MKNICVLNTDCKSCIIILPSLSVMYMHNCFISSFYASISLKKNKKINKSCKERHLVWKLEFTAEVWQSVGPQAYFWDSVSSKADDDIVGAFYGIVKHSDKKDFNCFYVYHRNEYKLFILSFLH